jgi:hypothetical protein
MKQEDVKVAIEIVGESLFGNVADDPGFKSAAQMNLSD